MRILLLRGCVGPFEEWEIWEPEGEMALRGRNCLLRLHCAMVRFDCQSAGIADCCMKEWSYTCGTAFFLYKTLLWAYQALWDIGI